MCMLEMSCRLSLLLIPLCRPLVIRWCISSGVAVGRGLGVSRTVIVLPAKTEALHSQWQRQTPNNPHVHRLISVPADVLLPILA